MSKTGARSSTIVMVQEQSTSESPAVVAELKDPLQAVPPEQLAHVSVTIRGTYAVILARSSSTERNTGTPIR